MEKLPINISLDQTFFKEEENSGFLVTHQSKLLWAVILDLMVQFDSVCKEHKIKYCLDSGSLLGAVRHGGFIPWDNDADVIMLRSEYERFCKIAPKAFKHPYFWQTNDTDPGTMRRHGQLRNSMTTCILESEMANGKPRYLFNQGVFLDVFILDEVPDDANELKLFRKDLQYFMPLLWDLKEYYFASDGSTWIKVAQQQAYNKFEATVSRYNGTGQKRIANISLKPQRKETMFFTRELYEDTAKYCFEGFSFPGPRDYETILKGHYGDWHQLVIGDDAHGGVFFDANHSYTDYLCQTASIDSVSEGHPILKLYLQRDSLINERDSLINERDTLLKEQDYARTEIRKLTEQQKNLQESLRQTVTRYRKKNKRFMILTIISFILFTSVLIWAICL